VTGIPDVQRSLDEQRRPRPVLLGLLGFTVLVLAILWIRYDPVERGDVGTCPPGSQEVPIGEPDDPDEAVVCAVSNLDTTTVEFSTSAYNSGLLPVRMREVVLGPEIQGVLTVDEVLMWPANNRRGDVEADLVPFEAFRLPPGDERLIWVRATIPACEDAARSRVLLFRSVPLRMTVFGLPRDTHVPLDPPVRVIVERC
jgi:hypothetical protein